MPIKVAEPGHAVGKLACEVEIKTLLVQPLQEYGQIIDLWDYNWFLKSKAIKREGKKIKSRRRS